MQLFLHRYVMPILGRVIRFDFRFACALCAIQAHFFEDLMNAYAIERITALGDASDPRVQAILEQLQGEPFLCWVRLSAPGETQQQSEE